MTGRRPIAGSDAAAAEDAELRCYCFDVTVGDLRRDGAGQIARVEAKIRAGQCDCARKNPSGRCCLGDLRATVRRFVS